MYELRKKLLEKAGEIISGADPSHDLGHALRVLANAEYISGFEGGDLEVIIPAALFHDAITLPKNSPQREYAVEASAEAAEKILRKFRNYSKEKIIRVRKAIVEHPHSRGIKPECIESRIVQDADRLEATGAISIMRTFCSTGRMGRQLYNSLDPFCTHRNPEALCYAVDLFYERLLKVKDLMNTTTAKKLAEERTAFLHLFLSQIKKEIEFDDQKKY